MVCTRNTVFDIIKGITIVLVVWGHTGGPFKGFIYLFHVAVFFLLSGYFIKDSYSESSENFLYFVSKKLKCLWVPFFTWGVITLVLNNLFIKWGFYLSANETIYSEGVIVGSNISYSEFFRTMFSMAIMGSDTALSAHTWFLSTLFYSLILLAFIRLILYHLFNDELLRLLTLIFIGIILLIVVDVNHIEFLGLSRVLVAIDLLILGIILNKVNKIKFVFPIHKNIEKLVVVLFTACSLSILGQSGYIELYDSRIESISFFLSASILGWFLVYSVSYFINQVKVFRVVISFIGRESLWILILHGLVFKIVNVILVLVFNWPDWYIAYSPYILEAKSFWWLYLCSGVIVPIVIHVIWRLMDRGLKHILFFNISMQTINNEKHILVNFTKKK